MGCHLYQKNPDSEKMLEKTDLILVEQTQSGQLEAFGLLVKKYQQRVYNIAYRFTLNIDEANDLAQEIFLKAFRALPTSRAHPPFIPGYIGLPRMLVSIICAVKELVLSIYFQMSSPTTSSYLIHE